MLLDPSQELQESATAYINPLTSLIQLDFVKREGSKSLIVNAAASALNKIFLKLAK